MNKKMHEIEMENFTIIIYFVLLFIYLYANTIEVEYLKYQNKVDKERYRLLLYIVFGTSLIITLYYSIAGIENLKEPSNKGIYKLKELSVTANILIVFATIIYLYIIYKDEEIVLEVNP